MFLPKKGLILSFDAWLIEINTEIMIYVKMKIAKVLCHLTKVEN